MKKILLFAHDPGGANTVAPLFVPLISKKFFVQLYGEGPALDRYKVFGLEGKNLPVFQNQKYLQNVFDFILNEMPDLVITGTSAEDYTEKYIWKSCEKLNIPCFAILDQWMNYGVRFSRYKVSEIEEYNKNKHHDFLPSKIFVMDNYSKSKLIEAGILSNSIIVTGQPYFDWLSKEIKLNKTVNNLDDNKKKILFVSEPILQFYKESLGYTQVSIFQKFLEALYDVCNTNNLFVEILIKLHPREENTDFFYDISRKYNDRITSCIQSGLNLFDLLNKVDLVCGMSSMALIESVILKKKVISIQMGLIKENPFILDFWGILKSIYNKKDLAEYLQKILVYQKYDLVNFCFISDSIKNVLKEVEEIINAS